MGHQRVQRVAEQMKKEIADILRNELRDPRLGMVSITEVELSADLRYARVFVSVLGDDQAIKDNMEILERASGLIRRQVGDRLPLRFVPEISFRFDPSIERGARIAQLLHQVRREENHE